MILRFSRIIWDYLRKSVRDLLGVIYRFVYRCVWLYVGTQQHLVFYHAIRIHVSSHVRVCVLWLA